MPKDDSKRTDVPLTRMEFERYVINFGCPECYTHVLHVVRCSLGKAYDLLEPPPHCHPCEVCGVPVDCEDQCDGNQQTIVYCPVHQDQEGLVIG